MSFIVRKKQRADHVVSSLLKYVTDINNVKGLGFCVTVDHTEFMCRYFNEHGISAETQFSIYKIDLDSIDSVFHIAGERGTAEYIENAAKALIIR